MKTVTTETYYCEYCNESFYDKEQCQMHEETHLKDFSCSTNEEIAAELQNIADNAWDYRFGNNVMGLPYENFKSLLETAAKRLKENGGIR